LSLMIVASGALRVHADEAGDIAPTGSLRVAVGVGPAASPFWPTRDPSAGKLRGVTVELAKAAADKLGLPYFVPARKRRTRAGHIGGPLVDEAMFGELRKRGVKSRVIFVSRYAEEAFSKNLPEGEDFGFMPKPFTLKQLIEAVKANRG
jgi:hypothetical protein